MFIVDVAPRYLIYGVPNWRDVNVILAHGYIEADQNGYVPTKLLFQNIPREHNQSIMDYGYIFILNTDLLKKNKFKINCQKKEKINLLTIRYIPYGDHTVTMTIRSQRP